MTKLKIIKPDFLNFGLCWVSYQEVLAMQNHRSSGELLNLNNSGTSFTAVAVQVTNKITSKTTQHVKHTL